ncbi:MAG: lipid-binding SYLF domain-containing protein [Bryobacteraceae bacterium]|nr:lipid-binding SYLF domain-containing protein [Bryobacteraceae bacterium]
MFTETMEMKDQGIPQDLLNKSHCLVLIPGLKKGAFIVGGSFGRGFVTCRSAGGEGWSAPASVRLEGGSFGLQIGGSETDLILLVMNETGMGKLLSSKFTLGADASAAAGPVGRTAAAETDAQMRAEILAYSRARGVFAGISLKGSTLRPDNRANKELYGKEVANRDVVTSGMTPPAGASKLLSTLNKYSPRKAS